MVIIKFRVYTATVIPPARSNPTSHVLSDDFLELLFWFTTLMQLNIQRTASGHYCQGHVTHKHVKPWTSNNQKLLPDLFSVSSWTELSFDSSGRFFNTYLTSSKHILSGPQRFNRLPRSSIRLMLIISSSASKSSIWAVLRFTNRNKSYVNERKFVQSLSN